MARHQKLAPKIAARFDIKYAPLGAQRLYFVPARSDEAQRLLRQLPRNRFQTR
jgi:hypothetical protein